MLSVLRYFKIKDRQYNKTSPSLQVYEQQNPFYLSQ